LGVWLVLELYLIIIVLVVVSFRKESGRFRTGRVLPFLR
jgi:hypothetical protein